MEVKRLEDAFDLSGTDKPKRHYPNLKPVSMNTNLTSVCWMLPICYG